MISSTGLRVGVGVIWGRVEDGAVEDFEGCLDRSSALKTVR